MIISLVERMSLDNGEGKGICSYGRLTGKSWDIRLITEIECCSRELEPCSCKQCLPLLIITTLTLGS